MPDVAPLPTLIAVLAKHLPVGFRHQDVVAWCPTTAELVVLAQGRRLRGALLDGRDPQVDGDLTVLVRRCCPVLIVDDREVRPDWEALGATVLPSPPAGVGPLVAAVEAAHVGDRPRRRAAGPPLPAPVVAVLDAAGGDAPAVALAVARSLAIDASRDRPVVIADLSLDAPLRRLHGIADGAPGLPELVAAGRFGDPPASTVDRALHPGRGRTWVLPGLRQHRDWIALGPQSVEGAVAALQRRAGVVVALIDPDLEGEADTGSFDLEDRNLLGRTAVDAAELVVIAGSASATGRAALVGRLAQLAGFGVAGSRILVVAACPPRRARGLRRRLAPVGVGGIGRPKAVAVRRATVARGRGDVRLAWAVRSRLRARPGAGTDEGDAAPERIVPGKLGHWAHDIEGWITPRVPQQP